MIGIINCGTNNIQSLVNAFNLINVNNFLIDETKDFNKAHALVLPGVGSYKSGIDNLKKKGFDEQIYKNVIIKGKLILGICLGMQLLSDIGYEYGVHKGLGLINSKVIKFKKINNSFKIPHIGWNDINILKKDNIFKRIEDFTDYYFVHSYHLVPRKKSIITSECEYGEKFVSSIQEDNIYATQFHPEKSQEQGIELLKNWVDLI